MCNFETSWEHEQEQCEGLYQGLLRLSEMQADELVVLSPYRLQVTEAGRSFVRNICMAFDARLWANVPQTTLFSQTL